MRIKLENLYRKRTILTLWPLLIFSGGCISNNEPVKRPISTTQSMQKSTTLELVTYYRNEKYPMAIKSAQALLKSEPNNWEARLFLGLAYFNYGDDETSVTVLGSIPENIRSSMLDSCLELQSLHSKSNQKKLRELALKFFPDCLDDLTKPADIPEEIEIDDKTVRNYGQLYDASLSGEDDPEIRKLKEEEFLQRHKLTEEQLSEITARYLELITED